MRQINAIIVDDETIATEVLRELIAVLATDVTVVGTAKDGIEAIEKISTLRPNLVFMDLEMPLLDGYEVIQRLAYRSFYLVFTSGYVTQTLKPIHGIAYSYLSKPIDPADFLNTVDHVRRHLATFS